MTSLGERMRTLLVVGRTSNLPTVWSNCLAGWLLGGSGPWSTFALLCAGATLLYTGGMFLNDAVDAEWDRAHGKDRPIPAGRIGRGSVYAGACIMLVAGWLLIVTTGRDAALYGVVLVAAIVIYDLLHKIIPGAPVLMALCRLLLYMVAASAAVNGGGVPALLGALAIAGYITGLSYVARHESTDRKSPRWPLLLLLAPVALAFIARHDALWPASELIIGISFLVWSLMCLRFTVGPPPRNLGRCVGGLLAGIPLVDGLAATGGSWKLAALFAGMFLIARLAQRFVPAT